VRVSPPTCRPHPVGRVDEILCPVLAVYGDRDPLIPATEIERLRDALNEYAVPNVTRVFPGGDHGFFCDARPANYNAALAGRAWELTLRFLRRTLR
jgi:carboxymethylenebutenolidase